MMRHKRRHNIPLRSKKWKIIGGEKVAFVAIRDSASKTNKIESVEVEKGNGMITSSRKVLGPHPPPPSVSKDHL